MAYFAIRNRQDRLPDRRQQLVLPRHPGDPAGRHQSERHRQHAGRISGDHRQPARHAVRLRLLAADVRGEDRPDGAARRAGGAGDGRGQPALPDDTLMANPRELIGVEPTTNQQMHLTRIQEAGRGAAAAMHDAEGLAHAGPARGACVLGPLDEHGRDPAGDRPDAGEKGSTRDDKNSVHGRAGLGPQRRDEKATRLHS